MKTYTHFLKRLCISIFLIHFFSPTFSQLELPQKEVTYKEIHTLFQAIGTYDKMIIETDLDSLIINKRSGTDQPATITFKGENQTDLKFQIKVKARGKYRRVKCDIPPLKLNFSKSEISDLGLYRFFDKLKLVTHCYLDGSVNNAILKEHWVYKLYNNVSNHSFNTNQYSITYQHTNDPNRKIEGEGFIIEPNNEMAFRNDAELIDSLGVRLKDITPKSFHQLNMFNYMIGNTDWNIIMQKNVKFLRIKNEKNLIAVPYDFDNCKFVDAPYMIYYPDAKVVKTDNRYIKEKFLSKEALHQEMAFFKSKNNDTQLHCYLKCNKLLRSEKLNMKSYLNQFFKKLKRKKKMEALFLEDK